MEYMVKLNTLKLHKSTEINMQNAILRQNIMPSFNSMILRDARVGYHYVNSKTLWSKGITFQL